MVMVINGCNRNPTIHCNAWLQIFFEPSVAFTVNLTYGESIVFRIYEYDHESVSSLDIVDSNRPENISVTRKLILNFLVNCEV